MPQGFGGRRKDMSPRAQNLRNKMKNVADAKDAAKSLSGGSPLSDGKLKRDVAKAQDAAHDAALAYRKSRTGR